jgi:hypothetical protein
VFESSDVEGKKVLLDSSGEQVGGIVQAIYAFNNIAFLHHMAMVFIALIGTMLLITLVKPRTTPITYPRSEIDTSVQPITYVYGSVIILFTIVLYIMFW